MKTKAAMIYLAAYREGKVTEPQVGKALKTIENDSLLRESLAQQTAFDAGVREMLKAISAPADLRQRLQEIPVPAAPRPRPRETTTAMLSVALGVLVMLGLLVFFQWDGRKNFPGREALVRMVNSANGMNGSELELVSNPAGNLGDWFYMRGFDTYQLPPELRTVPAVGSRLFRLDGHMVAQVAVDPHQSLVYVFKGEDFGVQLPEEEWRVFEAEGWAAAARKWEGAHVLVAFRGTEAEMEDFVKTLRKR